MFTVRRDALGDTINGLDAALATFTLDARIPALLKYAAKGAYVAAPRSAGRVAAPNTRVRMAWGFRTTARVVVRDPGNSRFQGFRPRRRGA